MEENIHYPKLSNDSIKNTQKLPVANKEEMFGYISE